MRFDILNPAYQKDLASIATVAPWQELCGKRIAVSGATGLLGSQIVDFINYLNQRYAANIRIIALGRKPDSVLNRFRYIDSSLFEVESFELSEQFPDIKADYVIHCAGNSHPRLFAEDPVGTLLGNINGAEKVLRYSADYGAVILLLSSGEIYGENLNNDTSMSESYTGHIDLSVARSCYTEGKRAVEALCQSYISQFGAKAKIARPCRIFGPTMTDTDNKASAQFIKNGLEGKNIVLKSNGEQLFSYIYSADAVSALLTILVKGGNGEAYNVASERCNVRLRDFAEEVAEEAKVNLVFDLVGELGGSKVTNALLNDTKLKLLGWRGKYNLKEAITQTFKILKKNED